MVGSLLQLAQDTAHQLGMQAFPLVGKMPLAHYRWQEQACRVAGVQNADPALWEAATGYALLALPGSDLYIIDCDSAAFQQCLFEALPELHQTFTVYSGMPGHCHIYVRLSVAAEIKRLQLVENGTEVASLRGHGSYVVGPGSVHLETGQVYRDNGQWEIAHLSLDRTKRLLALFALFDAPPKPQSIHAVNEPDQTVIDRLAALFRAEGYRQNGNWLNGRCLHAERHQHGDEHPSFGFNTRTGGGNCFVCGGFSLYEVAAQMGVQVQHQPFVFQGTPEALLSPADAHARIVEPDMPGLQVELNVAAELLRQGRYQVARFYGILSDHARQHNGQHTYAFADLLTLGQSYRLSVDQVKKSLTQMVELGLLSRQERGCYRRVGFVQVRALLGLGQSFAPVVLPRAVYCGKPTEFSRAVLLAVEHYLPAGLSTRRIASAAGIGQRTVYAYENALGVQRTTVTERIGLARATAVNFVKVFDVQKQFVRTFDEVYAACEVAASIGGRAWGWRQLPSKRVVPILQTYTLISPLSKKMRLQVTGGQQPGRQSAAPGKVLPPTHPKNGKGNNLCSL